MPQLCHTLPLALVSLAGFSTERARDFPIRRQLISADLPAYLDFASLPI